MLDDDEFECYECGSVYGTEEDAEICEENDLDYQASLQAEEEEDW